jgi:hypothetical protein
MAAEDARRTHESVHGGTQALRILPGYRVHDLRHEGVAGSQKYIDQISEKSHIPSMFSGRSLESWLPAWTRVRLSASGWPRSLRIDNNRSAA